MKKLLTVFALILVAGCAPSTVPKPENPPSHQEACVNGCLNEYSSCVLECDKTIAIGPKLDLCYQQCKEEWAECKEDCSKAGNPQ